VFAGIVFSAIRKNVMEENKNTQQPNNNNDQRELDKNKTLNDPGANVVDYGRSEESAVNESNKKP